MHIVGDGRQVHGSKVWLVGVRGDAPHKAITLRVEHVPDIKGTHTSEADIATKGLIDLAPLVPGCLGALTDAVLRGQHLNAIQRATGWVLISPVPAARVDKKTGRRTEKEHYLQDVAFTGPDGTTDNVEIWTRGGAPHRVVHTDTGQRALEPLHRRATIIRRNKDGTYRSYGEFDVPSPFPGGKAKTIFEATTDTDKDRKRGFNRAENVRQIPPGDPVYEELYGHRSNAESFNRRIDDHLPLRRARSVGAPRLVFDLIAHAIVGNAIARHLYGHRATKAPPLAA